jgi:predicted PurR-regulated permease PerM
MNRKNATLWFLASLIVLFGAIALLIVWPFLRSLAAAVIVAVIFFPAYRKVLRWTGNRPTWASLLTTLAIVFLFLLPVTLVLLKATNEAIIAAQRLSRLSAEQGGFGQFVLILAERPLRFFGRFVDLSKYDIHTAVTNGLQRVSLAVLSSGASFLGSLARFTADFFLMLILLFFLFRDGEKWSDELGSLMPLTPSQTARLFRNINDTIIGNVYGIVSVGVIQGTLTGIATAIVGLPSPLLFSIAAFFASILPVVGAALVWVPAGLYLIFTGTLWKGVFILAWGAIVISMVDNVVRPWVVSGKVELHPLVLMFVILGGVQVFGFLGLFLGPVIVSVLAAIFKILREELASPPADLAAAHATDPARVP